MEAEPTVEVPGIEGHVSVSAAGLFSAPTILLDGKPAPAGPDRGTVLLPRMSGGTATARLTSTLYDVSPVIEVDGVKHILGPKVPAWLGFIAILPIGLLFAGGAIGGLLGALAVGINQKVVRGSWSVSLKAVSMLGVGFAALVLMIVAAMAIRLAIGR